MYHIYCDFDATVTVNDIWDGLFKRFGDPYAFKVWEKFNSGEYTAAQCISEACATVQGASGEEMTKMLLAEPLRAGFPDFVKFCAEQNVKITIVSDGFSLYIDPILKFHDLQLESYANKVELTPSGNLDVKFENARESCRSCGACKCGTIMTSSADEDTIVYIGDGYSDHCPVEISDVVFSRDMLSKYCAKSGIPSHPFEDFYQIMDILKKYFKDRPKYKRPQAVRNRNILYKTE
ncbi:MAG: MtnX-like HAD-IB family phosphatase [Ignavibacteriota bacterium]